MAQLVFIVSRDRPRLRDYLQLEFADNVEVTVIVDRRIRERRLDEAPHSPDRRLSRRRQGLIDDRLRSMGWAIVWRDDVTTVCVQRDETALPPQTVSS
jgi:hypothetical protein